MHNNRKELRAHTHAYARTYLLSMQNTGKSWMKKRQKQDDKNYDKWSCMQ